MIFFFFWGGGQPKSLVFSEKVKLYFPQKKKHWNKLNYVESMKAIEKVKTVDTCTKSELLKSLTINRKL